MIGSKEQKRLLEGIEDQEPISGLTHNFYRYPARFSPAFTRAVIQTFTNPDDLVYDAFMGGGTSLVEAAALGRHSVGTDINGLAVFVATVKTTVLSSKQQCSLGVWLGSTVPRLSTTFPAPRDEEWIDLGYQKNINTPATWRIRKLLEIALASTEQLENIEEKQFARCVLLKTGQWALDCRKDVPTADEFRMQLSISGQAMLDGVREYAAAVRRVPSYHKPLCIHRSAIGIEHEEKFPQSRPVSLVITSPPYPGVHVLYHRWQVRGRRETAAPFWIANMRDGSGASFYTFGDRAAHELSSYYQRATAAFASVAAVAPKALIVQMVAFSNPSWQLAKYLAAMQEAGLEEIMFPEIGNGADGRIWRSVPNRKWYASQQKERGHAATEVVLFHRKRN